MSASLVDNIHKFLNIDDIDKIQALPDMQSWSFLPMPQEINILGQNYRYLNAAQYAAFIGAPKCLTYILQRIPEHLDSSSSLNGHPYYYPYPLLHLAVLSENLECVRIVYLLSSVNPNFDINQTDTFNFTALHFAAIENKSVPNKNVAQPSESPPMEENKQSLTIESRFQIASFLISKGADLLKDNSLVDSPLVYALMHNVPLFNYYVSVLTRENPSVLKRLFDDKIRDFGVPGEDERTVYECVTQQYPPEDPSLAALSALKTELDASK